MLFRSERIRLGALDKFVVDNQHALHRILERTTRVDGKPKFEKRQIKPDIPELDWIGRYEHTEDMMTGRKTKTLFVPVSVINAMEELKGYKDDYRYLRKKYRTIGGRSLYCCVFDLERKFIGLPS